MVLRRGTGAFGALFGGTGKGRCTGMGVGARWSDALLLAGILLVGGVIALLLEDGPRQAVLGIAAVGGGSLVGARIRARRGSGR
ncbi:hypothetical protein ACWC9S_27535 [Streptomyces xiamenensis]